MAGEKYTNIGKTRWENANVGVIKWDPENKAGLASVIDETTGTVYEIGGGSGESDFSTATLTMGSGGELIGRVPCAFSNENIAGAVAYTSLAPRMSYTVILYKGLCALVLDDSFDTSKLTISGNAELIEEYSEIDITGDCTITVTGIDIPGDGTNTGTGL